jgi:hypothetical protein
MPLLAQSLGDAVVFDEGAEPADATGENPQNRRARARELTAVSGNGHAARL